jgi:ATP-dependent Clp protease adaptor protein ClpS
MEPYQSTMSEFNPWKQEELDTDVLDALLHNLIIWNDEVNTFDWVIESLVDVCSHTQEQAEQCALLIHYQGKYAVKKGNFDTLRPMCEALIDRGINSTIDN